MSPRRDHFTMQNGTEFEKRYLDEEGRVAEAQVFTDKRGLYLWQINIVAGERGHGTGSRLLAALCSEADRRGLAIRLTAVSGGALPQTQRLVRWYVRHGFGIVKWDNAEGCRMRREPRKNSTGG